MSDESGPWRVLLPRPVTLYPPEAQRACRGVFVSVALFARRDNGGKQTPNDKQGGEASAAGENVAPGFRPTMRASATLCAETPKFANIARRDLLAFAFVGSVPGISHAQSIAHRKGRLQSAAGLWYNVGVFGNSRTGSQAPEPRNTQNICARRYRFTLAGMLDPITPGVLHGSQAP